MSLSEIDFGLTCKKQLNSFESVFIYPFICLLSNLHVLGMVKKQGETERQY